MNPAGVTILVLVLVAATAFGVRRSRTEGRLRPQLTAAGPTPTTFTEQELGVPLGSHATLVQFSTVFCQPCRATRRILDEVAGMVEGVRHIDVDAESHLDLVRRLDIRRTPTIFVLDSSGQIVKRATGQPRKADVVAALGEVRR